MKLLYIIICLPILNCFGQIQNAKIEYGITIETFEGLEKTTHLKKSYGKAIESAKYLDFTLYISQENSLFTINDALSIEDDGYFYAKLVSGYKGDIYQNKKNSLSVISNEFGNFILKKEAKTDWVLINETKEIEGFLCFKATSVNTIDNGKGIFRFPVIAWYCPKIPFSYGPNGYGNLPGLILELQVRNILFGVKKIDLNLEKNPIIRKIADYKVITEKELNEIIDKNRRRKIKE
jgi:GLPGLI family protein